ncbi:MAG: methionine--tRNA ligase [Candidatus Aenigmatarchaeota archaeon]
MVVTVDVKTKAKKMKRRITSSKKKEKFYVTTPIYYINSTPTIGSAYTTIFADAIARFWRLKGRDVFFLTGLDENSIKTVKAAEKSGKDVKQYADEMAGRWKSAWKALRISNNDFIRTTEERHRKNVEKFFSLVYKNGDIYKGKYSGLYCDGCEAFVLESELVNGNCPHHNKPPKKIEEENYFFRLSKYQKRLVEYIEKNPDFIQPEKRRHEILNFAKAGLNDISISRPGISWGIQLPTDKTQVIWVWFDALINYLAPGGRWPADLHIVGKDILRFHALIWPAMLLSAKHELPKEIFAHGFFTDEGRKISKSLGNSADPVYLAGKYSLNALRYYLLINLPHGEDGDFSESALVTRFNNELVANVGNFIHRTLSFIHSHYEGIVPAPEGKLEKSAEAGSRELQEKTKKLAGVVGAEIENNRVDRALKKILEFSGACNQYFQSEQPWSNKRNGACLYNCANAIKSLAIVLAPFIPDASEKIWEQLNLKGAVSEQRWDSLEKIKPGHKIKKPEIAFKKIEEEKIKESGGAINVMKLGELSIEDFEKLGLRIGKVGSCEKIKDSNKLLRLIIDLGAEKRQCVAGIAQYYKPEELSGKNIVVVTGLKPVRLMGVESQCMLLATDSEIPVLLTIEKDVRPGTKIR